MLLRPASTWRFRQEFFAAKNILLRGERAMAFYCNAIAFPKSMHTGDHHKNPFSVRSSDWKMWVE